jgi:putative glutamine amidotransferase
MKPLIGVTTSELRASSAGTLRRHGEPPHAEMALGMTYLRAIEGAGGMPVVLPPLGDVEALLDRLDGICLSGGPDLDPEAYGAAERHAELGPTEPGIDAFELALARAADARGIPVLGICRGAQTLNVARGGTLHQHVPAHRQAEPATATTHTVHVDAGTRLARMVGITPLRVNSFHHQAVDTLGHGLVAVARAADGTIEAIEAPGARFMLGVQWHAEGLLAAPRHRALFEALVVAALDEPARLSRAA